ncbi:MAG TPA: hypothetical protein VFQ51_02750 [Vicinamibacteria bacterium]|nr:hypothetical protein [Vicinamibacteria bacterium]
MRALYDASVLFPDAEPMAPAFTLFRKTRTLYSVRLGGPLHALWADHLTRGLSGLGISVLNGFARRTPSGTWGVEFLVMPMPGAADPSAVDYVALTEQEPPSAPPAVVLDSYALDGSPEQAGLLYVEVRGPDRLGFLGGLLRLMAQHDLAPREMWIATWDGQAFDRFLLAAPDGRVPAEGARRALARALKAQRCS